MDIYHKPNDTERCLPYFASHPKHCIKYIPFEMARRVCIIVENNSLSLSKKKKNRTFNRAKEEFQNLWLL